MSETKDQWVRTGRLVKVRTGGLIKVRTGGLVKVRTGGPLRSELADWLRSGPVGRLGARNGTIIFRV